MTTAGSVGPSQAFRFTNSLRAPVGRKPRTPGVALACAVAQTRDPDPQLHPDEGRASTRNSSGCGQARRWPRSGAEHSEAPSSDGIPYLWRRKRAWQTYTQNGSSPGYVVPYRSAASSRASASVLSSTGWPRKRTSPARSATTPTASPSKSKARPTRLDAFLSRLRSETPPLARIDSVGVRDLSPTGEIGFRIVASEVKGQVATGIPADAATCADCLRELLDPKDRRYRYPFLNCTNCGPRFTITRRIPYDRPQTSMAQFTMCPACQAEYDDPLNRRFHAQPNACWDCGPRVWLEAAPPEIRQTGTGQGMTLVVPTTLKQGDLALRDTPRSPRQSTASSRAKSSPSRASAASI